MRPSTRSLDAHINENCTDKLSLQVSTTAGANMPSSSQIPSPLQKWSSQQKSSTIPPSPASNSPSSSSIAESFPLAPSASSLYVVGTVVFIYSWINVITVIFQCRPIQAAWDLTITNASCVHLNIEIVVFAVLNCVTDLITISLPMPLLWGLKLPQRKRLQLMAVFLAGGFVCIVSIYRIPTQAKISFTDASWSDVDAAVWSVVEVCIGIVAACLPTYRLLFLRMFGKGIVNGAGPFSLLNTDGSKKNASRKSGALASTEASYGEGSQVLRKPERILFRREDTREAVSMEELHRKTVFREGSATRTPLDLEARGESLEGEGPESEKAESRAGPVSEGW